MKRCSICKELKELTEFSKDKTRKDELSYRCKSCQRIKWKQYRDNNIEFLKEKNLDYYYNNKEKILQYKLENREQILQNLRKEYADHREERKRKVRDYYFKRNYKLTIEQAEEIYSRGCQLCGSKEKLCIDHCHDTGRVRGCLCSECNKGLGHFERFERLGLLDKINTYKTLT